MSQTADHTLTAAIGFAAPRGSRGFSLVELIVVMTVIGILIGIGVPSYKYVTNSNRVSTEINQLLGDMQFARSEAVKEGSFVVVCPSTNATSATPTCATGSAPSWNTGWVVFSNVKGDGTFDTGDQVLRAQPGFTTTDTLSITNDGTVLALIFNREGFVLSNIISTADQGAGGLVFKLQTTPTNQKWERCLLINYVGIMTTLRGSGTAPCN